MTSYAPRTVQHRSSRCCSLSGLLSSGLNKQIAHAETTSRVTFDIGESMGGVKKKAKKEEEVTLIAQANKLKDGSVDTGLSSSDLTSEPAKTPILLQEAITASVSSAKCAGDLDNHENNVDYADDVKHDIEMSDTATSEKPRKKGVVYLSRIPPFMGVTALRAHMERFGGVGRIFLTPEDPVSRKKRLFAGGSKKPLFKDGWVEFERKKTAQLVARVLNNAPVGGPKRHNFWRDDLWNIRYLPRFKWNDLLDYQTQKKKAREAKRQAELLQLRRENAHYLDQVERKRKLETITMNREMKRKKRATLLVQSTEGDGAETR